MIATKLSRLKDSARRAMLVTQGLILASAGIVPIVITQRAFAAAPSVQLTSRSVAASTGVPSAAVDLVFTVTTPDKTGAIAVDNIEIEFCDTPLGTCVVDGTEGSAAVANNIPTIDASPSATLGGTFAGTGLTTTVEAGDGGGTGNQIDIVIGTPATEDNKAGLTITVPNTTMTNDNTANTSYYPRIRFYASGVEEFYGAVAQSTSQTLTVNARVQEVLQFCIGTTPTDAANTQIRNTGNTADVTSCSASDGTSVDLGNVTSSTINTTPVNTSNQGDDKLAYAMVQTNAQNGVVIGYRAVQDTSSGKLKVVGATCSGVATTDQCFNSQGASDGAFTAGTENFGMTVAGVNCVNVGSNYTCNYVTTGSNLCLKAEYDQQTSTCGAGRTYVASNDTNADSTTYAWVDTGSSLTSIAGSDSSTLKVVANEALMIKFAATSQITTPTGLYQAQADFVATPTY